MNKIVWIISFLLLPMSIQAQDTFKNPVLSGFYPDPSVCRVGEDYYLVTSSFEWFPGIPIFHSKDLVHWKQIGHVLDRPSQLSMKEGMPNSNGLWAPTIRYNNGQYYVICTATGCGGNFFVSSDKPEGPYSEPIFIKDAPGIDPSLYFEDDGTVWYCGSINGDEKDPPRRYYAEDRIYIQQIDLDNGEFIGDRHIVTSGYAINSPFTEAPHIYKMNGKYYLLVAEGGTWENHAVTIFTADKVTGPYTPFICNPVLTHRHLGKDIDITTVGHADLIQTQFGDWYAVMLGVRPIDGYNMLGRETFLTGVSFDGDQPVFNPGIGRVLAEDKFPNLPYTTVPQPDSRDEFMKPELNYYWNFLRTPFEKWYTIDPAKGVLKIKLRPNKVTEWTNPSLIARRVQHTDYLALTHVEFAPKKENEEAGLVIMQNDRYHYRLILTREKKKNLFKLIKVQDGKEEVVGTKLWDFPSATIGLKAERLSYQFLIGKDEDSLEKIGEPQDATICSSNVAHGFIGPYMGMYASSNGEPSKREAEFHWFSYQPE